MGTTIFDRLKNNFNPQKIYYVTVRLLFQEDSGGDQLVQLVQHTCWFLEKPTNKSIKIFIDTLDFRAYKTDGLLSTVNIDNINSNKITLTLDNKFVALTLSISESMAWATKNEN